MSQPLTTLTLGLLTLLCVAGAARAIAALLRPAAGTLPAPGVGAPSDDARAAGFDSPRAPRVNREQSLLLAACALGSGGLFLYRWLVVYHRWQPLEAHVDGLLLMASILAWALLLLGERARLPGLNAFALPALAVILAWAVCASAWTFRPFSDAPGIEVVWLGLHRVGVYLGTLFSVVAGSAGAMYLFAQRRLHRKRGLAAPPPVASLEAIERLVIRSAGLGFALLTVGLATGLVLAASGPTALGAGWWHSTKVVLAFAAWLLYALLVNVRHTTHFRGRRAAWLSLAGVVLLFATFALATALESPAAAPQAGAERGRAASPPPAEVR